MATPVTFILGAKRERQRAATFLANAPADAVVTFSRLKRTGPQNQKLHAMITDVAAQVEWSGAKRDVEAWKDIFTAALRSAKHGLDVVPGINGGFVLLGMHTSQMTVPEVAELIELIAAFGAEHDVRFHEEQQGASGGQNLAGGAAA
jgi:hypothetical protein